MCCGNSNEQYCCEPNEALSQFNQKTNDEKDSITVPFSTCANYMEYDGLVYGMFNCPVIGYDIEANMCCGPFNEQFCCTRVEYEQEYVAYINQTLNGMIPQTNDEIELVNLFKLIQNGNVTFDDRLKAIEKINEFLVIMKQSELKNTNITNEDGSVLGKALNLLNINQAFNNQTRTINNKFKKNA